MSCKGGYLFLPCMYDILLCELMSQREIMILSPHLGPLFPFNFIFLPMNFLYPGTCIELCKQMMKQLKRNLGNAGAHSQCRH